MFRSSKIFPISFKKSENEFKNELYIICLDKLKNDNYKNAVLECGHKFHSDCILKWIENKNNCPICRVKFRFKLKKKS